MNSSAESIGNVSFEDFEAIGIMDELHLLRD